MVTNIVSATAQQFTAFQIPTVVTYLDFVTKSMKNASLFFRMLMKILAVFR